MEKSSNRVLTAPNVMSAFRILLIPVFIYIYCVRRQYWLAGGVIMLSAATDIADGYVARRFGLVTELGKILDPIADKLTQAAIIICLAFRFRGMWALFALLAVKEITMGLLGLKVLRRTGAMQSARWYGKLSTSVLYGAMLLHVLMPAMPQAMSLALVLLCAAVLAFSLTMYTLRYTKML